MTLLCTIWGQKDETASIFRLLYIARPKCTGYMYVDVSHFVIRVGTLLVLSVAALRLVATNTILRQDGTVVLIKY